MATYAAPPGPDRVFAFYSYTGGTGRTATVVNVAWILAAAGYRVLVADWSFPSPALHRWLSPMLRDPDLESSEGGIELLTELAARARVSINGPKLRSGSGSGSGEAPRIAPIHLLDYCVSVDRDFGGRGGIDLLPAGQLTTTYSSKVHLLDWDSFYYDRRLGSATLRALRESMLEHYDYILIDCASGVSDSAAVCMAHLADQVVACSRLGSTSVDGAVNVAQAIAAQVGDRSVGIVPVLLQVDESETDKVLAGRAYAKGRFADVISELDDTDAVDRRPLELPYVSTFAFEEIPATLMDPAGPSVALLAACERLTAVLTGGAVSSFDPLEESVRARLLAGYERAPGGLPDVRHRRPVMSVTISYAARNRMWAEWLGAQLEPLGVGYALRNVEAVVEAGREVTQLPADSKVIALLSEQYIASPSARNLWEALLVEENRRGRPIIVPLRLDTAELRSPFSSPTPHSLGPKTADEIRTVVLAALEHAEPDVEVRPRLNEARTSFPRDIRWVDNLIGRNDRFYGRTEVLEQMRNTLSVLGPNLRSLVLHGLDGTGKAEVAREYAYRFAADYDVVWRLSAETELELRSGLVALAARLEMSSPSQDDDDLLQQILNRTQETTRRVLLIFENVQNPHPLAERMRPLTGRAHVVLTALEPAGVSWMTDVKLDVFPRHESVGYLRWRAQLRPREAARIAERVSDLPLALDYAASVLVSGTPVEIYLHLLDEQLGEQASADGEHDGHWDMIASTWTVSLRRLRERNPVAAGLVELCAFFAAAPIPVRLLYSRPATDLLAQLGLSRTAFSRTSAIAEALDDMEQYSLARIHQTEKTVEMHRLVRSVVFKQLSSEQESAYREVVPAILAVDAPGSTEEPENFPVYRQLMPHVRSCALESHDESVRELVADSVRAAWRYGEWTAGRTLAEDAIETWTRADYAAGDDDVLLQMMRYHRLNVLLSQGEFKELHYEAHQLLDRLTELLGRDDERTLITATVMAASERALGSFREAREQDEDTLHRILSAPERAGGIRALNAGNNLAVSLRLVGDYQRALILDEETLQKRRAAPQLGEDHPWTLQSYAAVGRDHRELGDFPSSWENLRTAYAGLREQLGDQHEDTIRTLKSLAVTERKLGRLDEAASHTNEAVTNAESVFRSPRHPDRLALQLNQATDAAAAGDYVSARRLAYMVVRAYGTDFDGDHPFTLAATVNLAVFTHHLGRPLDALNMSQRTIATLAFRLPTLALQLGEPEHLHPWVLLARVNHGSYHFALQDYTQAHLHDRETHDLMMARLGEDHPDTLAAASNLAGSMIADGDDAGGQELRLRTHRTMTLVLGEGHLNTLSVLRGGRLYCDIELPPT